MSNNPVDTGRNDENRPVEGKVREKKKSQEATHVAFRIRKDAIPFYGRMIKYFYADHLIGEPKLSHLAKACLNIISNRFAAYEERDSTG